MLRVLFAWLRSSLRTRRDLALENLALRHQIAVLQRTAPKRLRITSLDRVLWSWLAATWSEWNSALAIVKPATVVAWHRAAFRAFWTRRIRTICSSL